MSAITMHRLRTGTSSEAVKTMRLESIDLLRGVVMIIMALDHTRDYFHNSAFVFNPEDLGQTNVLLFFTRWVTHFCAPVFVFLAGVSAYLYGAKKSRKELSFFLLTRGFWLLFTELFIISLLRTFNPAYHFFNLQVIWAIGISMIVLSAIIYMKWPFILLTGIILVAAHNLLDGIHVPGNNFLSFLWSVLHEPARFTIRPVSVNVHYPLLPWIGIMAIGYCAGILYSRSFDPVKRKKTLLSLGFGAIVLFIILRSGNLYGDAAHWSIQKNTAFSILSFLNVTKYPPSLLYTLATLGPACIVLALSEKPLNTLTEKIAVFGRVPMFYYLAHIFLIHLLAVIGAIILGYDWSDMVLSGRVNAAAQLKGYGFDLHIVYTVWAGVVLILYPLCKSFDSYKRMHSAKSRWLSYL
jgi:uncharacterized membrane protein